MHRSFAHFPGSGLPVFRERAAHSLRGCRRRFMPELERLEDRIALTAFTLTSPTSAGKLPAGVNAVGGIVLDLIGTNDRRVVSQLPASALFRGTFDTGTPAAFRGNPGTIGIQTGFTPQIVSLLGGGLAEVAVRLTLFDGDTAAGNFDFHDNELLLDNVPLGDFSNVATQETSQDGQTALSSNPAGGFRNNKLDTGFFYSAAPNVLSRLFANLSASGEVVYQLRDADPFDNFFDFTRGLDGGLLNVGTPPAAVSAPPVITSVVNDGPVPEGSPVRVTVTASDPDAPRQPLSYDFDFDNDGTFETTGPNAVALHTFANEGTYVIPVRVRDADGGEATASTTVEVLNAPPRLQQVSLVSRGRVGDPVTLIVRFTDPGIADTFTLRVAWGATTTTILLPAGSSAFEETRVLGGPPGRLRVTVTLADNGGGEAVAVASMQVESPSRSLPPAPATPSAPVAPPAQQPAKSAVAPVDATVSVTAVLVAVTLNRNAGMPTAAPDRAGPPVLATGADLTALSPPPFLSGPGTSAAAGGPSDDEQTARVSDHVAAAPPTPGGGGANWFARALNQFLADGPPDRPEVAPAAVAVDRPGLADPGSQIRPPGAPVVQAVAPVRTVSTVRVVVLLLATLLLSGRWSAGQRSVDETLRRRLGRKMAAFRRSQGG